MTEFGSDRYLEKFNQSQANATPAATPIAGLAQSQFILPLRGSSLSELEGAPVRQSDQKRAEKRGFNFLRNKFHVKGSSAAAASSVGPPDQGHLSAISRTARQR